MLGRTVVHQTVYQYLIPTLQVGSKLVIRRDTRELLDVYAVVRTLGTALGCSARNGLMDSARLAERIGR